MPSPKISGRLALDSGTKAQDTPKVRARFVLDQDGKPKGRSTGNYEIELYVEGAPEGTHAVTYHLDESYYDPVREARDPEKNFAESITSCGDFSIKVKIRTRDGAILAVRSLYDSLAETHDGSRDPDVIAAIEAIRRKKINEVTQLGRASSQRHAAPSSAHKPAHASKVTMKDLTVIGIVVAVVGVVIAAIQLTKADSGSVRTGDNSGMINTGSIGGNVSVTGHALDDRLREKAKAYVALAATSCKAMHSSIESFTPETSLNMMDMLGTVSPSLQMTADVAAYFGPQARDEVQGRIERLANNWVKLNSLNMKRMVQSMVPADARPKMPKASSNEGATFDARKQSLVEEADALCTYIHDLNAAP